jgi:hypothetical protein
MEDDVTKSVPTLNSFSYNHKGKGKDVLLTKYCVGDKIEKNEMDGACGRYGGRERCVQGVGGETRGKETIGETKA